MYRQALPCEQRVEAARAVSLPLQNSPAPASLPHPWMLRFSNPPSREVWTEVVAAEEPSSTRPAQESTATEHSLSHCSMSEGADG